MLKHYAAVVVLMVITALLVGGTYIFGDSPNVKRGKELDNIRENDLNSLKFFIENYTAEHKALPKTLEEIKVTNSTKSDPETNVLYEYKVLDATNYELCANFTFSTQDSENQNNYRGAYTVPYLHDQGYQCFQFRVTTHLEEAPIREKPIPLPEPIILQ
ncbi:MAG: hypothetical protein ACOZAO_05920 [Patescibacteria group bacterium]